MAITAWDLVSGVYHRIGSANLPSSLVTSDIYNLSVDAIRDTEQFLGVTIGSINIAEMYVPVLKNMTSAYAMAHTLGVDIDTEIGVGNIRLAYNNINQAEQKQLDFFMSTATNSLNQLGKRLGGTMVINHTYTTKNP
jgi:hypothetical protein